MEFGGRQTGHYDPRNEEERDGCRHRPCHFPRHEYRQPDDYIQQEFYDAPPTFAPPPPPIEDEFFPPQRPVSYDYGYAPPPPPPSYESAPYGYDSYASVQHVAHEERSPPTEFFPPSVPQESHHRFPVFHREEEDQRVGPQIARGQTVRIFCQAETDYSMTIRDGSVVLAPANPSDPYQYWIKDEKYSTRVKDQDGYPSFALVNKATGQALQHSIAETQPVRLTVYNRNELNLSVLWTLSKDLGEGFRTIRMVNNVKLNLDAFHGDEDHGGVKDGTTLVTWTWAKGDNQKWKITPYCKFFSPLNSFSAQSGRCCISLSTHQTIVEIEF